MDNLFQKRLREILKSKGMNCNQLYKLAGINKSTLFAYANGRFSPKQANIIKIAEALNIDPEYFTEDVPAKQMSSVKIPVLGHVAANPEGIYAVEDIIGWEEISMDIAVTGDHFGLVIRGDSMEPRILNGNIVIVKKQSTAETGDLVIALINGENATCKKLLKSQSGITLISYNPKYEPRIFSNRDIAELPVIILGKVVEIRKKW